jgi:hypothetical protein
MTLRQGKSELKIYSHRNGMFLLFDVGEIYVKDFSCNYEF